MGSFNTETGRLVDLPSYSPSVPAPQYSFEPAGDEQRIQHTPRNAASRVPTGTYIKKSGKTTVLLTEQTEGVELPMYGRLGPVNGTVLLEDNDAVTEVELEFEGKLDSMMSEAGGKTTTMFRKRCILWSSQSSETPPETCPSQLPFTYVLPSTFRDGDGDRPTPPSYEVFCHGVPTIYFKTTYYIRISITRVVHRKLGLWTKKKHILIPFKYIPRTRATRPILPTPCFFSSIKTSPEEWYQAVSTVKTRDTSSLTPLSSHLFLPAGRVYGIHDTIPFHIQLSGRASTLRELFCSSLSPLDRAISTDSSTTAASSSRGGSLPATPDKPIIRICLMREVTLSLRGKKSSRRIVIGEGTLTSVPPLLSGCGSYYSSGPSSDSRVEHLDWEGELRCNESVTCGGFVVANAEVKEFISFSISPRTAAKPQLLDMHVSVPIRIVTDSWYDTVSIMDSSP